MVGGLQLQWMMMAGWAAESLAVRASRPVHGPWVRLVEGEFFAALLPFSFPQELFMLYSSLPTFFVQLPFPLFHQYANGRFNL